jgi:CBS domain containing-hemolysin-like protein
MPSWLIDISYILAAIVLVLLNGFFVAAEFALVKIRGIHLNEMVRRELPLAGTARWLGDRLEASLSACQLGITMASLGLGWIGEPAFARLLAPLLHSVGVTSDAAIHMTAFIVAFIGITAAHLVIGEQAPKIFAIRRPEIVLIWCALPLKAFYILSYPLLIGLKSATSFLLRYAGIRELEGHGLPYSEEEIRMQLEEARLRGEMSRSEHRMLSAVFEFNDMICRRVMTPRADIVFLDIKRPVSENVELARKTKHTRYPVCEGSLDKVIGFVHVKDLVGVPENASLDLRSIMRPAHRVPETMTVSRLLRHFQETHQLMALVVDEYGTVIGTVTSENALEVIVGPVEDEFDEEPQDIVKEGEGLFVVLGGVSLDTLNLQLKTQFGSAEIDTISGLLTARLGRLAEVGDKVDLDGAKAEVIEVEGERAKRVRLTLEVDSGENA